MTAADLISSGILDSYCLGFTSREEDASIEEMAARFPHVQEEIEKIRASLYAFVLQRNIQPSAAVKTTVMHAIYAQQAEKNPGFVPLMHKPADFTRYYQSAIANNLKEADEPFDNLYVKALPSTNEVINFAVWVKNGHEEESHSDRNEYIAILEGSCDMFMDGRKSSYIEGEIISIAAGVSHYAVISSEKPMFALVQRQLL